MLRAAATSGNAELDRIEHFLDKEAIRATVRYYLVGFILGALVLLAPIAVIWTSGLDLYLRWFLVLSIAGGGIGAVTSVMVRITRGEKLSVDTRQGIPVTLLAGGFRPLVGAVFGTALYVFVVAGFLPVEIGMDQEHHVFAGLAFLAGFSERWAQDTIVRSAPISPSPATKRGAEEKVDQDVD